MLRPLSRLPLRSAPRNVITAGQRHQRRSLGFTGPALKRRTWKSSFARWGLAAGGVYWYASSDFDLFNKEANEHGFVGEIIDNPQEAHLPTVESIVASRRERQQRATLSPSSAASSSPTSTQFNSSDHADRSQTSLHQDVSPAASAQAHSPSGLPSGPSSGSISAEAAPSLGGPEALEEEADGQGAFNEETGEINWDCPCLGGMAHGPCGEQFRDAFSCFVYSKDEPKGVDCIDRFKTMQDCFREHPDIYGSELTDDVDEDGEPIDIPESQEPAAAGAPAPAPAAAPYSGNNVSGDALPPSNLPASSADTPTSPPAGPSAGASASKTTTPTASNPENEQKTKTKRAKAATKQVDDSFIEDKPRSENEDVIPKAAHDARYMNAAAESK